MIILSKEEKHDRERDLELRHEVKNENTWTETEKKNILVAARRNFFSERIFCRNLEQKMRTSCIPLIKIYSTTGNTYELDVTT